MQSWYHYYDFLQSLEASELEHDCLSIERQHGLLACKRLDDDDALDASENENDGCESIGGVSEVLKKT